jgi:hypothetical protein
MKGNFDRVSAPTVIALSVAVGIAACHVQGQVSRASGGIGSRSTASQPAAAVGNFAAFTWSHNQPPASAHVSGLVHIHPATVMAEAAAKLRALPPGKRYVIIQNLTEDLASHPSDQCVQRKWSLVTKTVPAPSAKPAAAKLSAAPLMKASASSRSAVLPASKANVTTTVRVYSDIPTGFRGPWMDNGIIAVTRRMDAIFSQLKSLGAEIDCLAVDNETWLHAASFLGNDGSLKAIEQDPRWPTLAKRLALPSVMSDMTWGSAKYFQWTEVMSGRFDEALNQAVFAPLRKHFPNAASSQYMSSRLLAPVASPDLNGHLDRRATAGFGTHENSEFYGWIAGGRIAKSGGSAVDPAWLAFRVEIHKIRGMNASSSRPKHAWIGARSWEGETWGRVPLANSPMWDELVLQLGMHGVRQFFELVIEDYTITQEANLAKRVTDRSWLERDLSELELRLGNSANAESLIIKQPTWSDSVIAAGQRVGNRCVWRFSFAPNVWAVRVQLSDGTTPTIAREPGRCGAWFEHPADLTLSIPSGSALPSLEIVAEPQASGTGSSR